MPFPYCPKDINLNKQGVPIPGTETSSESAIWENAVWPKKVLIESPKGVAEPSSLFEIFEQSVARHPNLPLFRRRVQIAATEPGQEPTWGTTTADTTYGEAQRRRTALGSALLSLERLGRLRDPAVPEYVPSPPEIVSEGIPAWGDRLKNGARRGWAVGIWSPNREEWQIVDFACQAYGLVSVSLYETLGPNVAEYITNHCPIPIIFASSNHLVELLKIAPRCPSLRVIVTMDPVSQAERDVYTQWSQSLGLLFLDMAEFEDWGCLPGNFSAPGPAEDEKEIDENRIVTISYTSGTTGNPKGVILTNWNMTAATISNAFGASDFLIREGFIFFSYLPLSHIYERFMQMLVVYGDGIIAYSTGDTTKLLEDAQVLRPNFFPGVPRVWNRVFSAIKIQMEAPGLKGALLRRAVQTKLENFHKTGSVQHRVYDALVFRKVRALVGGQVEYMCSGSAPLSAPVHEMLKICFSCDVVQGYGLTETVGTCSKGLGWDAKAVGTCGQIQPCNDVKLVDVEEMGYTHRDQPNPRGEVCIKGDNIFRGYLHDPENTAKALDADGWFHTGDIGEIDHAGRLKIVDRVKNVLKLSQGEYVALEKVEGVYALNPLFLTFMVHGDSLRSSLIGIAVLDPVLASQLVKDVLKQRIKPEDVEALDRAVQDPKVRAKIVADLGRVARNEKLNGFEMIKGVFPTVKPFPDDLLTPTQKVKRNVAAKHFREEIDKIYNEIEGSLDGKL